MSFADQWYEPIRSLHDRSFDDPWSEHLAAFNRLPAVRKSGVEFLLPHRRCAPAWFNGDIENLVPGQWVLVVSLNPHIDPADHSLSQRTFDRDEWWDYWRRFNLGNNWKGQFFPRLVRLASSCLGIEVVPGDVKGFAATRMLFVEFCPYASGAFPSIPWLAWKGLASGDPGFEIARAIRQTIFDFGRPALVLCNGQYATYDVKDQQFDIHRMYPYRIENKEDATATMQVYAADYTPKVGDPFHVVGFNQLGRTASSPTRETELLRRFVQKEGLFIHQS